MVRGDTPIITFGRFIRSERVTGLEPVAQSWQDRVLPLYYTRSESTNSLDMHFHNFISDKIEPRMNFFFIGSAGDDNCTHSVS